MCHVANVRRNDRGNAPAHRIGSVTDFPQMYAGCGIADQHGNIVMVSWGRLMATTGPDSPVVRELAGYLTAWKNLGGPSIGHYDIEILPHSATDIPTPLAGRRWTQPDRHATRIVTLRA